MSQNKIPILLDLIEKNPKDAFPRFALAKEYEKLGLENQALESYEVLINEFPEYGGSYYHYAILLIQSQKMDEAEAVIAKGLQILKSQNDHHLWGELNALQMGYFD